MTTFLLLLMAAAPHWEVPKTVSEIPVPAEMQTHGVPNRIHVVLSSMGASELYEHFSRAFVKAGLHVPPAEQQLRLEGQYMLTAFDPQTETSYSVVLQPYPSGNTLVIQGEAHFAGREIAPESDLFAPLFPGAKRVVRASFEGAETVSYSVRARPDEVLAFYTEVLVSEGFSAETDENGVFTRGNQAIQLAAEMKRHAGWTEVALMMTTASHLVRRTRGLESDASRASASMTSVDECVSWRLSVIQVDERDPTHGPGRGCRRSTGREPRRGRAGPG